MAAAACGGEALAILAGASPLAAIPPAATHRQRPPSIAAAGGGILPTGGRLSQRHPCRYRPTASFDTLPPLPYNKPWATQTSARQLPVCSRGCRYKHARSIPTEGHKMQIKSALLTDASGSIGGMTASRNNSGLYLRSRVVPVDPSTSRQNAVRSVFASLATEWIDLTEPQRQGWRDYAANVLHTPRFCGPINLTGQNQFIRTNTIRHQTGLITLIVAPTTYDTGIPLTEPTVVEIAQLSPPNIYTITVPFVSPQSDSGRASVYLSRGYSPSRTYFAGPYQFMDQEDYAVSATEVTFTGLWTAQQTEHPEPVPDQRSSLRFNSVTSDGRVAHQEIYPVDWVLDPP